ncbi:MAG: peptide-methionine (R)-S-oxide reductase, partial [Bradyrhizobium sp.]|nr:peptide-methionine (R)-S-oxide reductase [Bradyrhizobium sp.]
MIDRRLMLTTAAGLFGFAALRWFGRPAPARAAEKFEIEKT